MARSRTTLALAAATTAVLVAAGVAVVAATTGAAAATDAPDSDARGVSVAGTGRASGTPDLLRFTVGVQVTAASVDAALGSANAAQARVLAVLEQRGVDDRDVQTTGVRIEPRYDAKGQAITGYVVSEDVRVEVRELATAGETISASVAAGGDAARLSGVQFVLEDDEALREQARDAAFAQAKAKAEQYARLSGRELGAVQSIREDVRPPSGGYEASMAYDATAARASVPLEAGSTEVSVDVQVRWALR